MPPLMLIIRLGFLTQSPTISNRDDHEITPPLLAPNVRNSDSFNSHLKVLALTLSYQLPTGSEHLLISTPAAAPLEKQE